MGEFSELGGGGMEVVGLGVSGLGGMAVSGGPGGGGSQSQGVSEVRVEGSGGLRAKESLRWGGRFWGSQGQAVSELGGGSVCGAGGWEGPSRGSIYQLGAQQHPLGGAQELPVQRQVPQPPGLPRLPHPGARAASHWGWEGGNGVG